MRPFLNRQALSSTNIFIFLQTEAHLKGFDQSGADSDGALPGPNFTWPDTVIDHLHDSLTLPAFILPKTLGNICQEIAFVLKQSCLGGWVGMKNNDIEHTVV